MFRVIIYIGVYGNVAQTTHSQSCIKTNTDSIGTFVTSTKTLQQYHGKHLEEQGVPKRDLIYGAFDGSLLSVNLCRPFVCVPSMH